MTAENKRRRRKTEMAKSYSEQLAEWVKQRPQRARRDKNLVAFLAVKGDVTEAVEQGWAAKTIWAHMREQKRVAFSYDTFLNYIKKYVRQPAVQSPPRTAAPPPAQAAPRPQSVRAPPSDTNGQKAGFTFHAAPNKEELI
jgi:IS30 family transposase